MLRINFIFISSALSTNCLAKETFDTTDKNNINVEIQTIHHLDSFKSENCNTQFVPHANFEQKNNPLIFYFGNETSRSVPVAESSNSLTEHVPQNYFVVLSYPHPDKKGVKVSFVKVLIETTSDKACAYIISGGINEKKIQIALKGWNTYTFVYTVTIYSSATRTHPFIYTVVLVLAIFAWNKLF